MIPKRDTEQHKIRVLHLITALEVGGAEIVLRNLVLGSNRQKFEHIVITFMAGGVLEEEIREAGIRVYSLKFKRGCVSFSGLWRLRDLVVSIRPHVVHSWMYHASFLSGFCTLGCGSVKKLLWGIHHSDLSWQDLKWKTVLLARFLAVASRFVSRIVYCSETSRLYHEKIGYVREAGSVIPNGIDTSYFNPDVVIARQWRSGLCLDEKDFVIGYPGRFDPQKDHQTFMRAATIYLRENPDTDGGRTIFVLCGAGIEEGNEGFRELIPPEIRNNVKLIGIIRDMARFYNGLDLLTLSSSSGESFPMIIAEAMACGIPCAGTDVGDIRKMIGDTGEVVMCGNPVELAAAWIRMRCRLDADRTKCRERTRKKAVECFGLEKCVAGYETAYREILN